MATRKKGVQQESAVNDSRRVYTRSLFSFFSFYFCWRTFIRVRASISQVGNYYNDSLTVKILMTRPVDARWLVTARTPR